MISYFYEAAFDLSSLPGNTFNIKFSASGENEVQVTAADVLAEVTNGKSRIFHKLNLNADFTPADPYGPAAYADYADCDFAAALQAAMITAAVAWAGKDFTVSLSTTGYYTIARTGAFVLEPQNDFSKRLLGLYFYTSPGSHSSHTGTEHPWFIVVPTLDCISLVSDKYEPAKIASQAIPDSMALPYGLTRTASPNYYDWTQQFEGKARVFTYEMVVPHVWPFESLVKYCRTVWPLILYTDGASLVCFLREEGSFFKPIRTHPDFDDYWHIPFKTLLLGTIEED